MEESAGRGDNLSIGGPVIVLAGVEEKACGHWGQERQDQTGEGEEGVLGLHCDSDSSVLLFK